MLKVKICCIRSIEEALLAIELGASAIGLVSKMPSGPGVISEERITKIAAQIPLNIESFLLTSQTQSGAIVDQVKKVKPTTIQVVDRIQSNVYNLVRQELPHIRIVQVVHVNSEEALEEAKLVEDYVDGILLDSGLANSNVLGGTGRKHDWKISERICQEISKPVYLAGGINSENLIEAVETVKPDGIDLCTGVRSNGYLDQAKLERFFARVKEVQ